MNLETFLDSTWRGILELLKFAHDDNAGLRHSALKPFDSTDDIVLCCGSL